MAECSSATYEKFHDFPGATCSLEDGKLRVLILDEHASHVVTDLLRFAVKNNIDDLFRLTSAPSARLTQNLDVCIFTVFKRNITTTTTTYIEDQSNHFDKS